jgi:hypothetical protein
MKKLIVFSVIFVLLASAAFAEVSLGGSFVGTWFIARGDDEGGEWAVVGDDGKQDQIGSWIGWKDRGPGNIRGRVNVNAENEDGTMGGFWQMRTLGQGGTGEGLGNVWWKPMDQFKMTLGYLWGGYNFSAPMIGVNDEILPVNCWGRTWGWAGNRRAFQGYGWEVEQAASFEIFPMDNLYILVSIDYTQAASGGNKPIGDVLMNTAVRVGYNIEGIGQAVLTYDGGTNKMMGDPTNAMDPDDPFAFGAFDATYLTAHFNLTAVENLDATIAFTYALPISKFAGYDPNTPGHFNEGTWVPAGTDAWVEGDDLPEDFQIPMAVDLRFGFTADAFNIVGGVGFQFGGSYGDFDLPMRIGVTLNPSYDLGMLVVGLVGEVEYIGEIEDYADSHLGFNVFPYVRKNVGGGSIYAGFAIQGYPVQEEGKKSFETKTRWAIPVAFEYWF